MEAYSRYKPPASMALPAIDLAARRRLTSGKSGGMASSHQLVRADKSLFAQLLDRIIYSTSRGSTFFVLYEQDFHVILSAHSRFFRPAAV